MSYATVKFDISGVVAALMKKKEEIENGSKEAAMAGGKIIADQYKIALRKHTKGAAFDTKGNPRPHLIDTVAIKPYLWPNGNGFSAYVGTSGDKKQHTHLLELGTKYRERKVRIWFGSSRLGNRASGIGGIAGRYVWVEILLQEGKISESNAGGKRRRTDEAPAMLPMAKTIALTKSAVENKVNEVLAKYL